MGEGASSRPSRAEWLHLEAVERWLEGDAPAWKPSIWRISRHGNLWCQEFGSTFTVLRDGADSFRGVVVGSTRVRLDVGPCADAVAVLEAFWPADASEPIVPNEAAEATLLAVVPDPAVWFSVSNAYRMVKRLPVGVSGRQALADASGRREWAFAMSEASAGDHYLRCHAPRTDTRELRRGEWEEYKKLGGGPYFSKCPVEQEMVPEGVHRAMQELSKLLQLPGTREGYDAVRSVLVRLASSAQHELLQKDLSANAGRMPDGSDAAWRLP